MDGESMYMAVGVRKTKHKRKMFSKKSKVKEVRVEDENIQSSNY